MAIRCVVAAIMLLGCGLTAPRSAQAQRPQPGNIADQFEAKANDRARGRRAAPSVPEFSAGPQYADKTPVFVLKGVGVTGATAVAHNELAKVYGPFLNSPVSQADLLKIANGITALYRQKGYALSRAFVPPQEVKEGRIQVKVVEGHIDDVAFEGADGRSFGAHKLLRVITTERPLRLATLERALLLLSDTPGLRIKDTTLKELGEASGRFHLTVYLEAWRLSVNVDIDNRGTADVGPLQSFISSAFSSALVQGDVWALNVMTIPNTPEELTYVGGLVDFPVGADGIRVGLRGSFSGINPDGKKGLLDTRTSTRELGVYAGFRPMRTREASLDVVISANLRHAEEQDLSGTLYDDRIQAVSLTADYQLHDRYQGSNYFAVGVRQGHGEPGSAGAGLSRFDGDGDFYKIFWNAARNQRLDGPWSVLLSTSGQWTSSQLLQSEQFYIGGPLLGRAFSTGALIGDSGLTGLLEMRFDSMREAGPIMGYQLYAFVDAGIVWSRDSPEQESLSSYGAGIRVTLQDDYRAGFEIAMPIDYHSHSSQDSGTRFLFSLSKSFKNCAPGCR